MSYFYAESTGRSYPHRNRSSGHNIEKTTYQRERIMPAFGSAIYRCKWKNRSLTGVITSNGHGGHNRRIRTLLEGSLLEEVGHMEVCH